uniref:Uncharacterized protein n=1 Tax=Salix viminalis TaxID=40686 RepID=A0A6N2NCC3_SALVM
MDWTTNLNKISKQLNKYCHPTCRVMGFSGDAPPYPSRTSSAPATSTWLGKENSISSTDQEVIGSDSKKATYNFPLKNKWTSTPRKIPREVCKSFYETWVRGRKPLYSMAACHGALDQGPNHMVGGL